MLDINNSLCTTRHLITLFETFLTILFFNIRIKTKQYFLKATQNINMKINIQLMFVCCMANNNIVFFLEICVWRQLTDL